MESLDGLKQPGSDCARRHRDDSGPERRGSGRVRPTQHFYMHSPRTHAHATQHTHRTHTLHSYHTQHTRTTYIHAHRQRSRHTRTLAWAHAQTRRKHHRARAVESGVVPAPLPCPSSSGELPWGNTTQPQPVALRLCGAPQTLALARPPTGVTRGALRWPGMSPPPASRRTSWMRMTTRGSRRCVSPRDPRSRAARQLSMRGPPTPWTILQQDGLNHLGLWYGALPEHQMALITSGCAPRGPRRPPTPRVGTRRAR